MYAMRKYFVYKEVRRNIPFLLGLSPNCFKKFQISFSLIIEGIYGVFSANRYENN